MHAYYNDWNLKLHILRWGRDTIYNVITFDSTNTGVD